MLVTPTLAVPATNKFFTPDFVGITVEELMARVYNESLFLEPVFWQEILLSEEPEGRDIFIEIAKSYGISAFAAFTDAVINISQFEEV